MISDATWLINHAFAGARYPYLGENDNESWRRSFWLYASVDECALI